MLCHCIYKEVIKLTTSTLDRVPIGPTGFLPGAIEKPKERKDFVFNGCSIKFSTTPCLGPDTCYVTKRSLEVNHALLSRLARVWDNLGWRALISQCIEESIEPETLQKWT
jgi:hypothetical protein